LQRFLEGLDGRSLQGVVYLSTTGVYGSAAGGEVDENTPPAPADEAGARRLAAETVVASWCAARSIRCVVLRVPGIYGPHRLPLDRLKGGEPVLRPEDAGPGNRIHVEDLVTVCEAALEQAVAGVIPVGDGNHASIGAFMERVAALGGLPPPRRVTWGEAQREISPGLLAYLQSSRRVLTHRMRQELGVTPRYTDLDAGICASLQEMGLFSSAER
jgi:nucleoside-diphosphate-sugar epimerase